MDKDNFAVLKEIYSQRNGSSNILVSFDLLSKNTGLAKDQLDAILIKLDSEHYISEYVLPKMDSFIVKLNLKGLDALLE